MSLYKTFSDKLTTYAKQTLDKMLDNDNKYGMNYINRIEILIKELNTGIYEKEQAIKLVLLAFISGKSCFLYGPPGTAKSLIARRVALAFITQASNTDSNSNPSDKDSCSSNTESNTFFAYLMNRFSTPEEIFGPIDIAELKQNRLTRNTQGYLPTAHFAFLDEIWKSSPAILNTLLTIINEKIYRDGNSDIKVPLKGLVCASNEFPAKNQGLEALYDRLVIRLCVLPVERKESFEALLQAKNETKITISNPFSLNELEDITKQAKQVIFSKEALQTIHSLRVLIDDHNKSLEKQMNTQNSQDSKKQNEIVKQSQGVVPDTLSGIYISDRRWSAMAELLRIAALLSDRKEVLPADVTLLSHCLWSDETQKKTICNLIAKALKYSLQSNEESNDMQKIQNEYNALYHTVLNECYTNGYQQTKRMNEMIKGILIEKCDSLIKSINSIQVRLNKNYHTTKKTMYNPFLDESDYKLVLQGIIKSIKEAKQLCIAIEQLKHIITHQPIPVPSQYNPEKN